MIIKAREMWRGRLHKKALFHEIALKCCHEGEWEWKTIVVNKKNKQDESSVWKNRLKVFSRKVEFNWGGKSFSIFTFTHMKKICLGSSVEFKKKIKYFCKI
jgi:hypothetical protein